MLARSSGRDHLTALPKRKLRYLSPHRNVSRNVFDLETKRHGKYVIIGNLSARSVPLRAGTSQARQMFLTTRKKIFKCFFHSLLAGLQSKKEKKPKSEAHKKKIIRKCLELFLCCFLKGKLKEIIMNK